MTTDGIYDRDNASDDIRLIPVRRGRVEGWRGVHGELLITPPLGAGIAPDNVVLLKKPSAPKSLTISRSGSNGHRRAHPRSSMTSLCLPQIPSAAKPLEIFHQPPGLRKLPICGFPGPFSLPAALPNSIPRTSLRRELNTDRSRIERLKDYGGNYGKDTKTHTVVAEICRKDKMPPRRATRTS